MSKQRPYIIGIAGGSGSGKTSVAVELCNKLPSSLILHLDDFQKIGSQPAKLHGYDNWEHPEYVDWDLFLDLLKKLKNGEKITVIHRDQTSLSNAEPEMLIPKDIVIVEGYLLFHHPEVRQLLDTLVFLDSSDDVRVSRRSKFKDNGYVEHVLLPMHHKYVEPTKEYASLVIDTEKLSIQEAVDFILREL